MKYHLKYLVLVLRHKWYVFLAGRKVGKIPLWRLLIHDYSKFSKAEWTPYVNRFVKGRAGVFDHSQDDAEWNKAWEHHWKNNPHHWEYWLSGGKPTPMPDTYVREMVADWMGAGRAYTGKWDAREWYYAHKEKIILMNEDRDFVEYILERVNA